jgi:DNA-binding MurR/RpiR family transcriptional regulator
MSTFDHIDTAKSPKNVSTGPLASLSNLPVVDELRSRFDTFTPKERAIASYLLNNLPKVAIETARSVSEKLGISEVTVGRFCRSFGYPHFKALKTALHKTAETPWISQQDFESFVEASKNPTAMQERFELEMKAIRDVYQMQYQSVWKKIVDKIASASEVKIVGFQTERGFAATLAYELQYFRKSVSLIDSGSGHFSDALQDVNPDTCLIIIDTYRYSTHSIRLARTAAAKGLMPIILADDQCDWANQITDLTLRVCIKTGAFWASWGPFAAMLSLLINDVIRTIGQPVYERLEATSDLYRGFVGYSTEDGENE